MAGVLKDESKVKIRDIQFCPQRQHDIRVSQGRTVHNDQYRVVEEAEELHCCGCNRNEVCRKRGAQSEVATDIRILYQDAGTCDFH